MDKVEQIKEAITKAANNESNLTQEILDLPSFSTQKIKHLLNNLGTMSKRFMEIGLHKSGTFISALHGNECFGIGIDNWSQLEQDGESKELAYANCEKYLRFFKYIIIEGDCFQIKRDDLIENIDMFSYDGEHSYKNQLRAIEYFKWHLSEEFIYICDDFSWEEPKRGTYDGIKNCDLKIVYEQVIWDGKENGDWHNGIGVFLLKKAL